MTVREIIQFAGSYSEMVLVAILLPFGLTILVGTLHPANRGGEGPWKYIYRGLNFWVCIPRIFS